jgi:hypothetical protein
VGDDDLGPDHTDLQHFAEALADAICARIPSWVVGSVERVMVAWSGTVPSAPVAEAADAAAAAALDAVGTAIRALLRADIDEQRTTPLAVLRGGVRYPTEVLLAAGVPPVARDRFSERAFPDDYYDLSPASLADFAPELSELGSSWGAAKAFEHKRRHRRDEPASEG